MQASGLAQIIVATITAGTTIFTVIWSTRHTGKKLDEQRQSFSRNDAKQSIMQMMLEDKVEYYLDHKLPENHSRIHEEYDEYRRNGGNGLMTKKLNEYDKWHEAIEAEIVRGK